MDIVGASLIYKFGLPVKFDGYMYVDVEEKGEKGIKTPKKYVSLPKLGLLCLIIGFILQLLSNCLNE